MVFHKIIFVLGVCVSVCVGLILTKTQKCANNWLKMGRLVFRLIISDIQYEWEWRRSTHG